MGQELPQGVNDPESKRSKRRQAFNAAVARGRRSYQNAADAAFVAVPMNGIALPIIAFVEYQKFHEIIKTDWIATGLTIFVVAAEYIFSNYLLSVIAQENI